MEKENRIEEARQVNESLSLLIKRLFKWDDLFRCHQIHYQHG